MTDNAPRVHVHDLLSTTADKVISTRYNTLKGFAGPPDNASRAVRQMISKARSSPRTGRALNGFMTQCNKTLLAALTESGIASHSKGSSMWKK